MVFGVILFVASLVGIALLFAFKYWEEKRGALVAPGLRAKADAEALHIKALVFAARTDLARVPPELVRLLHILVHEAALGFAKLARASERQAHRLADMVSHKRHFEPRETRSEFLKKVSEHKNGGSNEEIPVPEHNQHTP